MVCGQIHAPATLPNYVHIHFMNKVLRRQLAYLRNLVCLFRYAMLQGALHYLLTTLVSSVGEVYGTPFPSQNKPSHCVTVARDLTTSTKMD